MSFSDIKVKIIDLESDKCVFQLFNCEVSIANSLRRIMISEVPTVAIDLVEIENNTTCLHDEFLAHRIGLIPLTSSRVNELNYSKDCMCDQWCEKCSVEFQIDVSQNQNDTRIITTKDLTCTGNHRKFVPCDTTKSQNQYSTNIEKTENIVIVKINRGQELKLKAIGKKGIGKMHSKWSPVSTVTYHFIPEIKLNRELVRNMTPEERLDLVNSCPSRIFSQTKDTVDIEDSQVGGCTFCMECVERSEEMKLDGLVLVREKRGRVKGTYNFTFTIESSGALPPEKILNSSIEILNNKLNNINKELDQLVVE